MRRLNFLAQAEEAEGAGEADLHRPHLLALLLLVFLLFFRLLMLLLFLFLVPQATCRSWA